MKENSKSVVDQISNISALSASFISIIYLLGYIKLYVFFSEGECNWMMKMLSIDYIAKSSTFTVGLIGCIALLIYSASKIIKVDIKIVYTFSLLLSLLLLITLFLIDGFDLFTNLYINHTIMFKYISFGFHISSGLLIAIIWISFNHRDENKYSKIIIAYLIFSTLLLSAYTQGKYDGHISFTNIESELYSVFDSEGKETNWKFVTAFNDKYLFVSSNKSNREYMVTNSCEKWRISKKK